MKIYTKTGDKGETSLFGGKRVSKDILRIEAYGTVDELNSIIGVCRAMNSYVEVDDVLHEIQNDLFTLGADLATSQENNREIDRIQFSNIDRLENRIDKIEPALVTLTNFILPGGNRTAAMLHFARTVCRRAERLVVKVSHQEEVNRFCITYLNRLSDLLFVLARRANALSSTSEKKWNPR